MEAIVRMWEREAGRSLPRPVCLAGDVAEPGLGMCSADRRWVAAHCDRMIHNAAVVDFKGGDAAGELWRTNLEGTRHALALAGEAAMAGFHYVSTAYVCGKREGLIAEDDLDEGPGFRNDYEHSKFAAENLVRQTTAGLTTTIYRPAVIVGDSQTGYTGTYHGLFACLRLISMVVRATNPDDDGVRRVPILFDSTGNEPLNFVPVDWVSAVICRVFETPRARGRTFHLAPAEPFTSRDLIRYSNSYFASAGGIFPNDRAGADHQQNELAKAAYAAAELYRGYETSNVRFRTDNAVRFAGDLPCPPISEAMIHRFYRFGERDNWGKGARQKTDATSPAGESIAGVFARAAAPSADRENRTFGALSHANGNDRIGLDVLGPGGGQYTLGIDGRGNPALDRGLPSQAVPTARITAGELLALVNSRKIQWHETASGAEALFAALIERATGDAARPRPAEIPPHLAADPAVQRED